MALPVNPCNSVPLHFVLCWAPTWEFTVLFYHQICEKVFQYWCFLKLFVLKVSKGKPAAHSLAVRHGGFLCWAPPSLTLGRASVTTSPVGQTRMHQKPCASSCALWCSTTSALCCLPFLQLSESKNSLPWLKLQSGCILLKINKLWHQVP